MKKFFLILCILAPTIATAQTPLEVMPIVSYETVTIGATAVGLSAATLISPQGQQVQKCVGRLETAQIRIGFNDVLTPTAAVGTVVEISDTVILTGYANIKSFRGIRTGASGTITFFCSATR